MKYFTTTSKASRRAVDCVIVGIDEHGKLGAGAVDVDASSNGAVQRYFKSGDVSGKLGSCAVLTDVAGVRAARVVVVGLGKSDDFGARQYRRAILAGLQSISKTKSQQVLNCLTLENVNDADAYYLARYTAQAVATCFIDLLK